MTRKPHSPTSDTELLFAYLDGELDRRRLAQVEARLSSDPSFKQLYEDILSVRDRMDFAGLPALDDQHLANLARHLDDLARREALTAVSPGRRWSLLGQRLATAGLALATLAVLAYGLAVMFPTETDKAGTTPARQLAATPDTPPHAGMEALKSPLSWRQVLEEVLASVLPQAMSKVKSTSATVVSLGSMKTFAHTGVMPPRDPADFDMPLSQVLTSGSTMAMPLFMDRSHGLTLAPGSSMKATMYASGLLMLELYRGGLVAVEKKTPLKDAQTEMIRQLAVKAGSLLVLPVGTTFMVRYAAGHQVQVSVSEGLVRTIALTDSREPHTIAAGSTLHYSQTSGRGELLPLAQADFLAGLTAHVMPVPLPRPAVLAKPAMASPGAISLATTPSLAPGTPLNPPLPPIVPAPAAADDTASAPQALGPFFSRVRSLMASRRWTAALDMLTNFRATAPGEANPEALYLLGICQERQGLWPDALATYEHYLTSFPAGDQSAMVRKRLEGVRIHMTP